MTLTGDRIDMTTSFEVHPPEVEPLAWARMNFKGDLTGPGSDLMRMVYGPSTFESGGMYFVVARATYDADADLTRCEMGVATAWHMIMAGLIDAPPGWSP